MIIGISGVARSGKDTLANNFVKIFKHLGIKAKRYAYGTHIRRALNENCWIDTLSSYLKNNEIAIISDVRYKNEADWIQKNGFLIHIARLDKENNLIKPANSEELENDPILQAQANLSYVWQTVEESKEKDNPFSLSEYSWAIFEQCFDSEEITQWQTTYPLSKKSK